MKHDGNINKKKYGIKPLKYRHIIKTFLNKRDINNK